MMEKKLEEIHIKKLQSLERKIEEAKRELLYAKKDLKFMYGCNSKVLGIISYKETKRRWGRVESVKEYTMLGYISNWEIIGDAIIPRYCHVSKDGGFGNHISLFGKEDFVFEPLEGVTLEEAKRILKDVKSNKQL